MMTTRPPNSNANRPRQALTRLQAREADAAAIKELGIPSIVLMENAGRGVAQLMHQLGVDGRVLICAGKGNNGGDGFVIARHLAILGCDVRTLLFGDPDDLRGDALTNYQILVNAGQALDVIFPSAMGELDLTSQKVDWVVDALLGTGTQGEIREPYLTIIRQINDCRAKKMAIDLPSGMDCDTGQPLGTCVRADHTATFIVPKIGFQQPGAEQWTGSVHTVSIGIPPTDISIG